MPTETQWSALLQRHATITVSACGRVITGDLYNVTNNQVILIVPNKEDLFEVIERSKINEMSW